MLSSRATDALAAGLRVGLVAFITSPDVNATAAPPLLLQRLARQVSSLVKTSFIHVRAGNFESVIPPISEREKSVTLRGVNAFGTSVGTCVDKAGAGFCSKD